MTFVLRLVVLFLMLVWGSACSDQADFSYLGEDTLSPTDGDFSPDDDDDNDDTPIITDDDDDSSADGDEEDFTDGDEDDDDDDDDDDFTDGDEPNDDDDDETCQDDACCQETLEDSCGRLNRRGECVVPRCQNDDVCSCRDCDEGSPMCNERGECVCGVADCSDDEPPVCEGNTLRYCNGGVYHWVDCGDLFCVPLGGGATCSTQAADGDVEEDPTPCNGDEDCDDGYGCLRGICTYMNECERNRDCEAGYLCEDMGNYNLCRPTFDECDDDTDCAWGEVLRGGRRGELLRGRRGVLRTTNPARRAMNAWKGPTAMSARRFRTNARWTRTAASAIAA